MEFFINNVKNLLSNINDDNIDFYQTLTKHIGDCVDNDNRIDTNLLEMITMIDKEIIFRYINLLVKNGFVRYAITLYDDKDTYPLTKNMLITGVENKYIIVNGNHVRVGDHNIVIDYYVI